MPTRTKRIATSLPQEELAELDRVRERQSMTRSQALRAAVRWYIGVMRRLPPAEEPLPDEVGALREAREEFARGGGRPLRNVFDDLERHPKSLRKHLTAAPFLVTPAKAGVHASAVRAGDGRY